MKIGFMNDPRLSVEQEVRFAIENGFQFLDLTIEPPCAHPGAFTLEPVRGMIRQGGLEVVGHTAFYLPFDAPYEALRRAAADIITASLDIFADLSARFVTVHLHTSLPFFIKSRMSREELAESWGEFLSLVLPEFRSRSLTLMLENCPSLQDLEFTKILFDAHPEIAFHMDIGHMNLTGKPNKTRVFLEHLGSRLRHVHISDNIGGDDLHLPLGAGNIDWPDCLAAVKHLPYDGTITLEVFSPDRSLLIHSRDKLRSLWDSL